jgi:hypothetical protein
MTVEIIDVEQGTPDWWAAKLGIPSASNFSAVLAGGDGKTRSLYMRKLAGEIVWGHQREDYRNADMDRGNAMEPHLRATYALMKNAEPKMVGFVKRTLKTGFAGYSPDAFVGDDGLLEVKSAAPHVLIEIMRANRVPPEHLPQAHGGMLVTGRAWCDVIIGFEAAPGYPGAEPPVFRVRRDTGYIARLELALETFNADLIQMVEWVRRWGKVP